eukprot:gene2519-1574_t
MFAVSTMTCCILLPGMLLTLHVVSYVYGFAQVNVLEMHAFTSLFDWCILTRFVLMLVLVFSSFELLIWNNYRLCGSFVLLIVARVICRLLLAASCGKGHCAFFVCLEQHCLFVWWLWWCCTIRFWWLCEIRDYYGLKAAVGKFAFWTHLRSCIDSGFGIACNTGKLRNRVDDDVKGDVLCVFVVVQCTCVCGDCFRCCGLAMFTAADVRHVSATLLLSAVNWFYFGGLFSCLLVWTHVSTNILVVGGLFMVVGPNEDLDSLVELSVLFILDFDPGLHASWLLVVCLVLTLGAVRVVIELLLYDVTVVLMLTRLIAFLHVKLNAAFLGFGCRLWFVIVMLYVEASSCYYVRLAILLSIVPRRVQCATWYLGSYNLDLIWSLWFDGWRMCLLRLCFKFWLGIGISLLCCVLVFGYLTCVTITWVFAFALLVIGLINARLAVWLVLRGVRLAFEHPMGLSGCWVLMLLTLYVDSLLLLFSLGAVRARVDGVVMQASLWFNVRMFCSYCGFSGGFVYLCDMLWDTKNRFMFSSSVYVFLMCGLYMWILARISALHAWLVVVSVCAMSSLVCMLDTLLLGVCGGLFEFVWRLTAGDWVLLFSGVTLIGSMVFVPCEFSVQGLFRTGITGFADTGGASFSDTSDESGLTTIEGRWVAWVLVWTYLPRVFGMLEGFII